MIGGQDEEVVVAQQRQPSRHPFVDATQRPGEAVEVVAVAVDLVGLDQVGEDEAAVEPGDELGGLVQGARVGRTRVLDVDAHPGEQLAHLAHSMDRDAVALLDDYVESEPFLVRISAAKRLRDRVERDARGAREGRVTAARVAQSLAALTAGQAA